MFSVLHGLGLLFFLMITHGIFYKVIGEGSEHLPLIGGLAVFSAILIRHKWAGISLKLLVLVISLVIVMAVAGLFGINQQNSFVTILLFSKGLILLILLAGTLTSADDVKVMTLYCLAGLFVGAWHAIYQYLTGTFAIKTIYVQRAASLRGDPNDTAMLLVAGVPLIFYWISNCRSMTCKSVFIAVFCAILAGIVLTGSRGGFLALLFVLTVLFLRRPSIRLFFIGLFGIALMIAFAPQSYWERTKTIATGKEINYSQSISNRVKLQVVGLEIFFSSPLLGVGPGNFSQAFFQNVLKDHQVQASQLAEGKTFAVAHNMYLEFFVENGIIAGILLLAIFYFSIKHLLHFDRGDGKDRARIGLGFSLALALGGMLFAGLFLSQGKNSVLWFTVGIGYAMGMISKHKRSLNVQTEPTIDDAVTANMKTI
ncbi:MAG: hypothetical protein HPY67_09100 [Syntrophaceae bacterium]|nr:hypothetical protein [Syntrophaceae bacterium]